MSVKYSSSKAAAEAAAAASLAASEEVTSAASNTSSLEVEAGAGLKQTLQNVDSTTLVTTEAEFTHQSTEAEAVSSETVEAEVAEKEVVFTDQRAPKAIVSNEPNDRFLNSFPYLSVTTESQPVISTIEATEANLEEATTTLLLQAEVVEEEDTTTTSTTTQQPASSSQPQPAEPTHRKVSHETFTVRKLSMTSLIGLNYLFASLFRFFDYFCD